MLLGKKYPGEGADDALYDSYIAVLQPQVHQQQEGNDGPEGGSENKETMSLKVTMTTPGHDHNL